MWYLTHARVPGADSTYVTGYATSEDGLRWRRPDVGTYAYEGSRRNNLCMVNTPGGMGVIRDTREPDASRRFKSLFWHGGNRSPADVARGWGATEQRGFYLGSSPDGARWTLAPAGPVLTETGDTQSLFGWDEAYGRYVSYVRPKRAVRGSQRGRLPAQAGDRAQRERGLPEVVEAGGRAATGRGRSLKGRALLHAGAALPRALRGDRPRLRPLARSVRPVLARADPQPGRHPLAAPQRRAAGSAWCIRGPPGASTAG